MYPNELIKGAMAEQAITIDDIKEATGLSPTTISAVRNGKVNIKLPTLKSIANAVGLELEIRLTRKAAQTEKAT